MSRTTSPHTSEKDGLCSFQEPLLGFRGGDWIQLPVSSKPVTRVVCIANRSQQGRYVGLLPYCRCRFQAEREKQIRL